jgi:dephospho-CoA kinase
MNKPLLIVITGRPSSGKTTLACIISKEIKCPVVSRDELKEGYINTQAFRIINQMPQLIYIFMRHFFKL